MLQDLRLMHNMGLMCGTIKEKFQYFFDAVSFTVNSKYY
jgi:hypothetical protein